MARGKGDIVIWEVMTFVPLMNFIFLEIFVLFTSYEAALGQKK